MKNVKFCVIISEVFCCLPLKGKIYNKREVRKMQKIICKKMYDTETSTIVKKNTFGYYGDPCGYEETLYVTAEGNYFIYTNGGAESKYQGESIKRVSAKNAQTWLEEN